MSLKKNILASYAGQIYVTLIGIVILPLYIKYMGAEAYGLVGFFSMLQAWFALLDMGLTPTMARETARFHGGATDALNYRRLVRALEGVFLIVALVGGLVLFFASGYIARDWLHASRLPIAEVQTAVQLMAIIIALRWMCGLYRGVVSGSERLVWLSGYNSIIATLRFVAVLPILMFVGVTPTIFFSFQFVVAVIEFAGLLFFSYHLLPTMSQGQHLPWEWSPLKPVLKFSLTIAFTSSVWVLVTQTDKLVLSKILPLAEYGYFTLAVLVASGVMVISGPVSGAIMPRMTRLQAEGDETGLIRLYRSSTQLVAVIVLPVALVLAFYSKQVLWIWTGDALLVSKAAPVLTLYSIGSGILSLGAFPYYLQYAKGDLKLHLIGNFLFVLLLVPSLIWATLQFGTIGAGWAWLLSNLIYFMLWVPVVHHRFARGLHWSWIVSDVIATCMPAAITAWLVSQVVSWTDDRLGIAVQLCVFGIFFTAITSLSSSYIRTFVACRLQQLTNKL